MLQGDMGRGRVVDESGGGCGLQGEGYADGVGGGEGVRCKVMRCVKGLGDGDGIRGGVSGWGWVIRCKLNTKQPSGTTTHLFSGAAHYKYSKVPGHE